MENQKRGPFAQQQADLTNAFENLRESTQQKINLIMDNHISDDTPMKNFRPELDKQIETLHLMVSSYFGDCDRRKQRIEAVISEQVDVSGFKEIGAALCS
ncbi:hypothetical protein TRFO_08424 [Tritrichomonas foetus]|uniref:Uncharacterized protein n=1 Tax=Tritrichomonas foetus TaxID=1144522 RepID=A0A1J4JJZ6_9EUKA|nr:hypothetical protein TRFO_08424 [Tritrichomonas foetus]|eukprot:OHS99474.1 hypothetical protein TRFO_08424 [Tritrichomonas foetus]